MQIAGLAAIVTGGGSGLGTATARALAAAGAKVALFDRNLEAAESLAADMGGMGFAVACDVADAASTEAAFATAKAKHGPARILINCAGVGTPGKVVGKEGPLPLADFERVIKVNLIGTFNCLRLAAAEMSTLDALEGGERGIIISTASVAAFDGQIGQAAYAASKGGVVALSLPAARELARFGIRVNAIAPGLFLTPMLLGLPQAAQDSLGASVPFPNRLGNPAEYAKLAVHMVENPMLNGEVVRLDGALRMAPK